MGILGGLVLIVGLVCAIIITIEAFQNEVWKGLLCLFCPFYILYYALVEYEAEKKPLIVGLFFGAWIIRVILIFTGGMGMLLGHGPLGR